MIFFESFIFNSLFIVSSLSFFILSEFFFFNAIVLADFPFHFWHFVLWKAYSDTTEGSNTAVNHFIMSGKVLKKSKNDY